MASLLLRIITPEKEILSSQVSQVRVPSVLGPLGILPNHTHLLARLVPGELKMVQNGQVSFLAVGDGLVEVFDNQVKILTDLAVKEEELDEQVLIEARERAQEALAQTISEEEYAATLANLERATFLLKFKRRRAI